MRLFLSACCLLLLSLPGCGTQGARQASRGDVKTAVEGSAPQFEVGTVNEYAMPSPPQFNTEAYDRIEENDFLSAKRNPLSTFSIDVDTGSYSNVRRMLTDGIRPPADSETGLDGLPDPISEAQALADLRTLAERNNPGIAMIGLG